MFVASGVGELAGVALGAAVALSVGAWVETRASVDAGSGVTGLGADVAAPLLAGAGSFTVTSAPPGVGVWLPQASRASRITRPVHRGNFNIQRTFPSVSFARRDCAIRTP